MSSDALRVALVATEASPLARHTGRADMACALARSLAGRGHAVSIFLPAYRDLAIPPGARREVALAEFEVPTPPAAEGEPSAGAPAAAAPPVPATLLRVTLPGAPDDGRVEFLLVQPRGERRWFERPGLWIDPTTVDPYPDNAERFAFFGRAVLAALRALDLKPDVLHAFDPRAAWALAYLKRAHADDGHFVRTVGVLTALDLADDEPQPVAAVAAQGLARDAAEPWARPGAESRASLLKLGMRLADALVLPSPRHADELREDRARAGAFAAVLASRERDTFGLVHGVDTTAFDPATDPAIAARYDRDDLSGKALCRAALAERAGWASDPAESTFDWPIVGLIGGLTDAQGAALVRGTLPRLLTLPLRLFVLGHGDPEHNAFFSVMARRHPARLCARLAFDDRLVRELLAGSDLFLLPARDEPSGRQALRALRYGAVPVAHATGALADLVADHDPEAGTGNGFLFTPHAADPLVAALERALEAYRQPHVWQRLTRAALAFDGSWERTASAYEATYREVRRRLEARRFGAWALGIARG